MSQAAADDEQRARGDIDPSRPQQLQIGRGDAMRHRGLYDVGPDQHLHLGLTALPAHPRRDMTILAERYEAGSDTGPDMLQHDGQEITLITPHAPLGRQLLGQGPGDQVQAATQAWEVLRVE